MHVVGLEGEHKLRMGHKPVFKELPVLLERYYEDMKPVTRRR